jgi:predicted Zn-dependent protease with MMP-like domain
VRRRERARFDALLDEVVASLPDAILDLFDEKPLVIEDRPSADVLQSFGLGPDDADEICGLHSGPMGEIRPLGVNDDGSPIDDIGVIHVYREGIVACAGGWTPWQDVDEDGTSIAGGGEDLVREEIRITILHEVGHHFGLDEDELDRLGFG